MQCTNTTSDIIYSLHNVSIARFILHHISYCAVYSSNNFIKYKIHNATTTFNMFYIHIYNYQKLHRKYNKIL